MISILIDTNIILDIALKREPHFTQASDIFNKIDEGKISGYISATSITDIYYIASKEQDQAQAKAFLIDLVEVIDIVGVDKEVIIDALHSGMIDFEDAVQVSSAEANGINVIVTRNVKDFKESGLEILEPKALLEKLKQ